MVFDFDMFGSSVALLVLGHTNGGLVVFKNCSCTNVLVQQVTGPFDGAETCAEHQEQQLTELTQSKQQG